MIKTKYWLSILAISVVLIAGSLSVSPVAIADGDDEIVITGTAGRDRIIVDETEGDNGAINCRPDDGSCTVTGPVTQTSTVIWTINSGAGDGFDTKYVINGIGGPDFMTITDGSSSTDDDEFEIENAGRFEYFDGPGDDTLEFEG